jgi:ATP-dependent helicase/nuclease subunit A
MVDLARRFEAGGASSFRGFVERLRDQAARHEAADAPVLEDGSDGVRIMTVHKAKGLEFPVVVLADSTVNHTGKPSRHIDPERGLCLITLADCIPSELREREAEVRERDEAESVRLTYVAATRARDLLVVPAIGDQRMESCWVDVLHPALYPRREHLRQPRLAPGCPPFGGDTLAERPPRGPRSLADTVAPGEHTPEAGEHSVVWWDPAALELRKEDQVGLRQQEILKDDELGGKGEASIRAHEQWRQRRSRTLGRGGHPTLVARTVTEQSQLAPAADPTAVSVERVDGGRYTRPHGRRFGTLVHAILAEIPFEARAAGVQAASAVQGRYLGCSAEEVEAAAVVVGAALAHPLLRRAAGAVQCRREVAVSLRLDDGTVLDGVVDLAFADAEGAWTVVDFKTDLGGQRTAYEDQVRLYARAIAEATRREALPVLLYV